MKLGTAALAACCGVAFFLVRAYHLVCAKIEISCRLRENADA